jgi:hypothetical protein
MTTVLYVSDVVGWLAIGTGLGSILGGLVQPAVSRARRRR